MQNNFKQWGGTSELEASEGKGEGDISLAETVYQRIHARASSSDDLNDVFLEISVQREDVQFCYVNHCIL